SSPMPSRASAISVSAAAGQPPPGSTASSAAWPDGSAAGSGAQSSPRQIAGFASTPASASRAVTVAIVVTVIVAPSPSRSIGSSFVGPSAHRLHALLHFLLRHVLLVRGDPPGVAERIGDAAAA